MYFLCLRKPLFSNHNTSHEAPPWAAFYIIEGIECDLWWWQLARPGLFTAEVMKAAAFEIKPKHVMGSEDAQKSAWAA